MSERSPVDSASFALFGVALVAGLVQIGYLPFLFGPIGLLAVLIGSGMSARYRRFGMLTLFLITVCFVIGAAVAVWDSRALY